ncbi:hypothetical protein IM40_06290 [Candidatus Paracaedimonas acanthamoebae]|nr:hypothetical protein IM40_06290 [Candidatus Paracaedimonas acanthamoebae]
MYNCFLTSILFSILIAFLTRAYGSDAITDEDFTLLTQIPASVKNLFPDKFSGEQIAEFYKSKQIVTPKGTFSAGDDFHQTKPYSFQIITGTYSAFASHISFTGNIEVGENCLWGTYSFKSPYSTFYNRIFKIKLIGDSFKIFNLADSILGDKDFISSPTQPLKDASFYLIKNTDETFFRQTSCIHRLNNNIKNWLLILKQLQGENIYALQEEERNIRAEELFTEYLYKNNFMLNDQGILSMEEYVDINKDLRTKIFACHGVHLNDILDVIIREDVIKLYERKLYFISIKSFEEE